MTDAPDDESRTDDELVRAAARGETGAFDELYRRHRRIVLAVARRVAGSDADAHDAVQETFVYLVRKLPTLELRVRLSTFLYPVVRRFALAARARAGRVRSDEDALEAMSREVQQSSKIRTVHGIFLTDSCSTAHSRRATAPRESPEVTPRARIG